MGGTPMPQKIHTRGSFMELPSNHESFADPVSIFSLGSSQFIRCFQIRGSDLRRSAAKPRLAV